MTIKTNELKEGTIVRIEYGREGNFVECTITKTEPCSWSNKYIKVYATNDYIGEMDFVLEPEEEIELVKAVEEVTETKKVFTERQIENRIKKLQAIEAKQKELEAQAEAIKAELKADMEERGEDEIKTKNFFLRWKEIVSNRFDSKALKKQMPDVYQMFVKESSCRRFTIA